LRQPEVHPHRLVAVNAPTESTRGPKREPPPTSESDAATHLVGFTSPNGNVGCIIDSAYVRCDVAERDWPPASTR
jgi:hypothetical protein